MILTLKINGEYKSFYSVQLKGIAFLKLLEAERKLRTVEDFKVENFHELSDFICYGFGHKFTEEELMNSINLDELFPIFTELGIEVENQLVPKEYRQRG